MRKFILPVWFVINLALLFFVYIIASMSDPDIGSQWAPIETILLAFLALNIFLIFWKIYKRFIKK